MEKNYNISPKTELAILFQKEGITENLQIFFPIRFGFGETDKKSTCFFDYTVLGIYLNSDISFDESSLYYFNYATQLGSLMKKYGTNDLKKIIKKIMEEINDKVFFVDLEDEMPIMQTYSKTQFYDRYGIQVNSCINSTILNLIEEKEFDLNLFFELVSEAKSSEDVEEDVQELLTVFKNKNIKEAYEEIKSNVISQDKAIKQILTAVYKNNIIDDFRMKTNVLICGNSGMGKTEILRQIQKIVELPMIIEDMNSYTVAGYVGNSVEDLLRKLYIEANGDLELAEHGILCLDEIDKKAFTSNQTTIAFDGVLNSLLKIIEGGVYEIAIDRTTKINFDKSRLTVIASGAFSKMNDIIKKNKGSIGFDKNNLVASSKGYATEDFVSYGMPREFIGRFSTIVKLNDLSKDDLKSILLKSKISTLKINKETLKKLNVNVKLSNKLIDNIVEKAYNEKTGARALEKVINELFDEAMFDALPHMI